MNKNVRGFGSHLEILKAIQEADNILIFHHIRPDGDCLGSQGALAELIKKNFPKKNVMMVGNDYGIFSFIKWKFSSLEEIGKYKDFLAIVVDVSDPQRIEEKELFLSKIISKRARIDHHEIKEDSLYDYSWVDPDAGAAAEMVIEFAYLTKLKITKSFLEQSYLGLLTDTGRFLYSGGRAKTLQLGSWILEQGYDPTTLYRKLYNKTMKDMKYEGFILNNFVKKGQVLYFIVHRKDTLKFGMDQQNASIFVNLLANIEDNKIWVFVIENDDHTYRLRIRSNGPSLVRLAQEYHGGGHKFASGASIDNLDQLDGFIEKCNLLIKETEGI